MKNNACFNCINSLEGILAENTGWYNPCKFDIKNEGLQNIKKCKKYTPNNGFQLGGYYTKMHFEKDGKCLSWYIHGDGEFPSDDPNEWIKFHVCDFNQIEKWAKFWGKQLRKGGLLND